MVRILNINSSLTVSHTYAIKGGGFVLGNLSSESTLCLSMREAGVAVVDVNYRHCPGKLESFHSCVTSLIDM